MVLHRDGFRLTTGQIAAQKTLHCKQRDRRFADRVRDKLHAIYNIDVLRQLTDVALNCETQAEFEDALR